MAEMSWAIFSDAELTTFIVWQAFAGDAVGQRRLSLTPPWHIRALQNLDWRPAQTPRRMQKSTNSFRQALVAKHMTRISQRA